VDEFEQYAVAEEEDEFEEFAVQEEAPVEPFPYQPRQIPTRYGGMMPDPEEEEKARIAASGVDVTSGAPEGVRTGYEAFAVNEGTFNDFLTKEFQRVLGPSAQVRKGPVSGKYEYFDPTSKRWTLVTHSDLGQEIISHAGEALNTLGSLASALGPRKATAIKETVSSMAKGGGGTFATDWVRQKIGDWLGVNESNTSEGERVGNAAEAAAYSAGGEAVGGLSSMLGRYLVQGVKGKPVFTPEEAQLLLDGLGKYDDIKKTIDKGSDVEFVPFLHQTVDPNNPAAAIAERWFAKLRESNDPEVRLLVAQTLSNQYGAIRSFFLNASKQFDVGIPATAEGREQAGAATAQGIQQAKEQGLAQSQQQLAQVQGQASRMVDGLPAGEAVVQELAGRSVRDQLWAQMHQSDALVNEKYKIFNDLVGFNPETNTSPYLVDIKDPRVLKIVEKFNKDTITGEELGRVVDGKVDLATLDHVQKRISELMRDRTTGGYDVSYAQRDLVNANKTIVKTLNDYLKQGSIDGTLPENTYAAWQAARAEAKMNARQFHHGFLADFLAKDATGQWVVKDRDVVAQIIRTKDLQAAEQLKGMIEGDPVAMREMKSVLFNLYREKATRRGLPSQELHDKFMNNKQYGPLMDIFFKTEDFQKLSAFRDVAGSLAATAATAKQTEKLLYKELGGKISRWNPENIVRSILSSSLDAADTRKLIAISTKVGGLKGYKDLQNGLMNEIQMQVFPQGLDGAMAVEALDRIVNKYGANINAMLGKDYLEALQTVRKTTPMLMRNPAKIGDPPVMTRFQQLIRGAVRPMSREGNFLAFLRQNRGANLPAAIWDALTDKAELQRLADYSQHVVNGTAFSATAGGQVGVQILNEQQDYVD